MEVLTLMMILAIIFFSVVVYVTSTNRIVPWMDKLIRVNPGVKHRAEWMAPKDVLTQVKQDYLAFYRYATNTLPQGWLPYMRNLEQYVTGELLTTQRESLRGRLRHDRGRLTEIYYSDHNVQVRNFSSDGLHCVVVDHQTNCHIVSYDYWDQRMLHQQKLPSTIVVYKMVYVEDRWKIDHLIQQMHPSLGQAETLLLSLPSAVGRDQ